MKQVKITIVLDQCLDSQWMITSTICSGAQVATKKRWMLNHFSLMHRWEMEKWRSMILMKNLIEVKYLAILYNNFKFNIIQLIEINLI